MTKKIWMFAFVFLMFPLFYSSASTIVNADITQNTTWNAYGSPYIISSFVQVLAGATLNIKKGVTVQSDGTNKVIYINGGTLTTGAPKFGHDNFDKDDNDNNGDRDVNNDNADVTFDGVSLQVFSNATLNLTNAEIKNFKANNPGITLFGNSTATILNSTIDIGGDGIIAFNHASIDADHLTIQNCSDGAILSFGNDSFAFNNIKLRNSEITANGFGLFSIDHTNIDVSSNSIHGNTIGVLDISGTAYNFTNNWWGDKSGPYNLTSNPTGTGDEVFDGVIFTPWLKYDPLNSFMDKKHGDEHRGHDSDWDKIDLVKRVKDREDKILHDRR